MDEAFSSSVASYERFYPTCSVVLEFSCSGSAQTVTRAKYNRYGNNCCCSSVATIDLPAAVTILWCEELTSHWPFHSCFDSGSLVLAAAVVEWWSGGAVMTGDRVHDFERKRAEDAGWPAGSTNDKRRFGSPFPHQLFNPLLWSFDLVYNPTVATVFFLWLLLFVSSSVLLPICVLLSQDNAVDTEEHASVHVYAYEYELSALSLCRLQIRIYFHWRRREAGWQKDPCTYS